MVKVKVTGFEQQCLFLNTHPVFPVRLHSKHIAVPVTDTQKHSASEILLLN